MHPWVTEAWAVRFGRASPEFKARRVMDLNTAFIAFQAALYLWRAMQGELLGAGTSLVPRTVTIGPVSRRTW